MFAPASWLLPSLFIVNMACFGFGTWTVFVQPSSHRGWNQFAAVWGICTCVLFWALMDAPQAPAGQRASAASLLITSLALFAATVRAVRSRRLATIFTKSEPQWVNMHGPYRFVRHPFYTAYCITYLACFVGSPGAATFGCAALMIGVYLTAARLEERTFATSDLSREYAAYKARTGMFLPKLGGRAP